MKHPNLSKISLICSAFLLIYAGSFFYPRWQNNGSEAQISWDAGGYYWYLPSLFIYNDIKGQHFKDSVLQKYRPTPPEDFQYAQKHNGNYVIRYTMGTAILESPWFLIAHLSAKPLGYPTDGFSFPYQFMIYFGGLVWALIGLFYLRKLLLFYYSDKTVAIALFLLVFGTNYLNMAGIEVGMSHTWLFTVYVLLILNTHYYYDTFKTRYVVRIAALIGLASLIRPPEIIAIIIPVFWGINNLKPASFKKRITLFASRPMQLIIASIITLALLSIPFIYWKYASGNWLIYTYQDQGFDWRRPHLRQYSFAYESGWLIYTPMMVFSIIGLPLLIKRGANAPAIILFLLIDYYIVTAWSAWYYGGRAMVQAYPVLMFPLAALIQCMLQKSWMKWILIPLMLIATYFNIWWTYNVHKGSIINSAPTTEAYFWKTLFRYEIPKEYQKLRDNEDLYLKTPHNESVIYQSAPGFNVTVVDSQSTTITFPITGSKKDWIRASANFYAKDIEYNVWFMTHFTIKFLKNNQIIKENNLRVQRFMEGNIQNNIAIDARVRGLDFDSIQLLLFNENKGKFPCSISHIKVTSFNVQ